MSKLRMLKTTVREAASGTVKTVTPGSWRTSDMSSSDRGYGHAWRKAREQYLRQHPLCVMCTAAGRVTEATVLDHRTPHRGNKALFWDENNWQSLCKPHHDSDKQRQENQGLEG